MNIKDIKKVQKLIKKKKSFTLTNFKKGFILKKINKEKLFVDVRLYELDFYRPKETKRVFEFNGGRLVKQTVYYKQHKTTTK